ncbi:MAG: hypothetical protein A3J29_18030 [Acidobacteria bacterium RIFCSPLOWO2_12_FULL_67_14b]|nr:MAG: hypothetical protein A3J29_18030 [Acidobacteria bacterium RIFCSPLOWO2_12_FULL_67_14b]
MGRLATLRLAVAATLVVALMGGAMVASQRSAAAMATAANTFLAGLSAEQRARVSLPFEGDERLRWHFIPNETFPRKGLTIKEMNEAQRAQAHALLKTGLSQRGYLTVTGIIALEDILKATETGGRMARNKEEYYFSVFGTPSAQGAWGWRVEGHHVSLRFTVVKGLAVASSPAFFGTNPAEVRDGAQKGLRLLAAREDTARALVESLDARQRTAAIINAVAPTDIVTMNKNDIAPLEPVGIASPALTVKQRGMLMQVIEAYSSAMEADIAAEATKKIQQAGADRIAFAWAGETARGKKHYYRVQGPTFLIEFDNTQNDGNHVHSVWRDFNGDFGRDLLREHLKSVAH